MGGSNHHHLADQGGKLISCVTECCKQCYWKQQTARDFLVFSFKIFLISVDGNIILYVPDTIHLGVTLYSSLQYLHILHLLNQDLKKKKNFEYLQISANSHYQPW